MFIDFNEEVKFGSELFPICRRIIEKSFGGVFPRNSTNVKDYRGPFLEITKSVVKEVLFVGKWVGLSVKYKMWLILISR